jgi:ribosomal protein S7
MQSKVVIVRKNMYQSHACVERLTSTLYCRTKRTKAQEVVRHSTDCENDLVVVIALPTPTMG